FGNKMSTYLRGGEVISSHFWDGGYVAGLLKSTDKWIHTSHSLGKRKLASLPQADHAKYSERIRTESEIIERCDAVIASTTLERRDLVNLYGADKAKINVIPPGVDTNRFHPPYDRQALKKELGFSPGLLVFTMGRLDIRKGFDLFFRAAAQVIEILGKQTDIQFVLSAGTDAEDLHEARERDRLAKLLKTLEIEKYVQWLPVLPADEVPLYYGASDVFVMPSRYELFGIVLLEAMACGVPVVATKFGGPPEIVSDGKDGRLVDPTDINMFASAIVDLLSKPSLRKQMGKTAREHVEERYCWKALARKHQKLYANDGEE
ncbi:MAG: glycosyltransferase, partial [Candidatus Bipolaricaulota bacterium]|nr:glycosyltransferase [Candidatus Bipolaricaulota bacterium]